MKPIERTPQYTSEYLSDSLRGIYTVTYYYTDGSSETKLVPKGIIQMPLFWDLEAKIPGIDVELNGEPIRSNKGTLWDWIKELWRKK